MAAVSKIDSNITGLRFNIESALKTPGVGSWYPVEPNSYDSFGGEITTVARNPINPSRQRKKGMVTDLAADVGFNVDLTPTNLERLFPGFFFAAYRSKAELASATITLSTTYGVASGGSAYVAGDLLFAKGFDAAANNGLKVVASSTSTTVVTTGLTNATTQSGIISKVGFQFGEDELEVVVSGDLPALHRVSGSKDMTTLGLIPGEWIFIGGDGAAEKFATAGNNGFARVRSVTTTDIILDKFSATMGADDGVDKTIRLFFGRVLKNETGSSIVRQSLQWERTLGAPDDSQPTQIQSEYVVGSVPNELTINIPSADKVSVDLSYVGCDSETRTGVTGVKAGTRPSILDDGAFNTSSDFTRIKLAAVSDTDEAPTPLFAYATELNFSINNNVTPNKAVGVLGSFDMTAGTFEVGGEITAYFADVAAIAAIRNNTSLTIDAHLVKDNKGISIDIPLLTLGEGRPDVSQDEPITLPLSMAAASGAQAVSTMDHTALMVFWDYLPDLAE